MGKALQIKKQSFMDFIIKGLIFCIIFQNVKLFSVLGAELKPVHFFVILAILYCMIAKPIKPRHFLVGICFLILPVLPLYRINDVMEWLKSYVIYVLICLFFTFAIRHFIAEFKKNYNNYIMLTLNVILFMQVLGIIQFISMNLFGYFLFQDFWGRFQFHYSQFGMSGGLYRAYSLFYEPSVFAWVSNTSLAITLFCDKNIMTNERKVVYAMFSMVAIACTLSASGLVITLVLCGVYILLKSKNPDKIISSCFAVLFVVLALLVFTDVLNPLTRIFRELQTPNTSGYERIVTPILYMGKVFENFPLFGRGLGQEGGVDIIGTIGRYSAVHNSIVGVIVCFGLSSLLFYIPAITYSVKRIKANRSWLLLLIAIFGIYISNGAFCSLDLFMFLILLVAVGIYVPETKEKVLVKKEPVYGKRNTYIRNRSGI